MSPHGGSCVYGREASPGGKVEHLATVARQLHPGRRAQELSPHFLLPLQTTTFPLGEVGGGAMRELCTSLREPPTGDSFGNPAKQANQEL